MTIYLRFEDGMQVETICVSKKPKEGLWYEAPKHFDWSKEYMLTPRGIEICTPEKMQAWLSKKEAEEKQLKKAKAE